MALLHVMQHVLHALGNALAFGFNGFLLGVGIEGQKIAGRAGRQPLLHGKADAGAGLGVSLYRVGQPHQGARIEQVSRCREGRQRVVAPGLRCKTFVFGLGGAAQAGSPQGGGVLQVLLLQDLNFVLIKLNRRGLRVRRIGSQITEVIGLQRLQTFSPVVCQGFLELLD